jgi:hypothetical protein
MTERKPIVVVGGSAAGPKAEKDKAGRRQSQGLLHVGGDGRRPRAKESLHDRLRQVTARLRPPIAALVTGDNVCDH